MSDLRISELPVLSPADAEGTDDLPIADYSASETKRLTLAGAVQAGIKAVGDGTIPGSKLAGDSVTALQLAPDSVGASELADASVDTAALVDLAVTNSKVAAGLDGAKLLADSVTAVQIAPAAITDSELAPDAVVTAAVKDGAITSAKLATDIDGAKLAAGSVTDVQLAAGIPGGKLQAGAITARELATGATTTDAVQDAAITDAKLAAGLDGAKFRAGTVPATALAAGSLTATQVAAAALDRGLDKTSGAIGHTNAITAGTAHGITYDAHGHVVSVTPISGADLPVATTTALGGVSVPAASGLTVSGIGALGHASAITAGTTSGFTYNSSGHITAVAPLGSADLPLATPTTAGAVTVPGPALQVAGGALTHADSAVLPGSYAKVTVDQKGHVTGGGSLSASDIPDIPATKLTSGSLSTTQLGDKSVTAQKLADYSVTYIQESVPSAGIGSHHIGMIWLQESTGQVSIWNGNSWMKTGASTLFNRNLRYCGTYIPGTGAINGVTQFGTAEGFKVGDLIPAADDKHAGCYFVASTGGTSASIAGGAAFDAGDWLLCQGTTGGWVRIDTLSGAGGGSGGGGVDHLDGLLDVTLTSPRPGDVLHFTAAGQWVNVAYTDSGTY